jgi:hypothetical protein
MPTPLTIHPFSAGNSSDADAVEPRPATPPVIVAGTRVSRELVRLMVAGTFITLEAMLRLGDLRLSKLLDRKRPT